MCPVGQFADGVSLGVELWMLGVLVFNLDIAKMFCRVALPICNSLHVKEVCVLPTLGFDGQFDFCLFGGCKVV